MHAVVVRVTINDLEAAETALRDDTRGRRGTRSRSPRLSFYDTPSARPTVEIQVFSSRSARGRLVSAWTWASIIRSTYSRSGGHGNVGST